MHAAALAAAGVDVVDDGAGAGDEDLEDAARVGEAAGALHVLDGVALDLVVGGLLAQDAEQLQVARVGADAVDDGERELALGQVLGEALVLRVLDVRQVLVVVLNLEHEPQHVNQRDAVDGGGGGRLLAVVRRLGLHQLDREPEQAPGLVAHHLQVVLLRRAGQRVPPEEVHALSAVEVEQLLDVYLRDLGIVELLELLQGADVDVVGRVDSLRGTKNTVRHR